MTKILGKFKFIEFSEVTRKGGGRGSMKKFWEIKAYYWHASSSMMLEDVRDICDPLRNKGGRQGTKWRFRSKKTAEQCYTMLILKLS